MSQSVNYKLEQTNWLNILEMQTEKHVMKKKQISDHRAWKMLSDKMDVQNLFLKKTKQNLQT